MTFQNKANLDSQGVENLSEGAYFLFELAFSQDIYKVFKRKSVIFFFKLHSKKNVPAENIPLYSDRQSLFTLCNKLEMCL